MPDAGGERRRDGRVGWGRAGMWRGAGLAAMGRVGVWRGAEVWQRRTSASEDRGVLKEVIRQLDIEDFV